MHRVADRVQAAVSIPLLHLADTTAVATGSHGHLRWPNEGTSSIRGSGHGATGRLPGVR
jgi:hypothetical protein